MARPTDAGSFAEAVYAQLEPLTFAEVALDYPLLKFVGAQGQMLQFLDDLVHDDGDGEVGWSKALDVNRAPEDVLPWLGQWIGTVVDTALSVDLQRQQLRDAEGWQRGTVDYMRRVIRRSGGLIGNQGVIIRERDTDPYHFTVITYPGETFTSTLTYQSIYAGFDYVTTVLTDLPVSYWRLGDAPATVQAFDEKLFHSLIYGGAPGLGAVSLLNGDPDPSVNFTASAMYAQATDNTKFGFTGISAMSCEAWIYPTTLDANDRCIFSKQATTVDGWALTVSSTALKLTRITASVAQTVIYAHGGAIAINTKYHIIATYDGANIVLYVNGVPVAVGTSNNVLASNTALFTIGTRSDLNANSQFLGRVDEAALYTYSMSAAQAAHHYTNGNTPPGVGQYGSYSALYYGWGSYYDLYLAGSGVSNAVLKAIYDTKPAGLQFTYTVSNAQDYWAVWADFLTYQNVFVTFGTYTELYNYSSAQGAPGDTLQLVGTGYYRIIWDELETYAQVYGAYFSY